MLVSTRGTNKFDLICFSHLRWDFVYQRPQHLMSRFAGIGRVFYVEEPIWEDSEPYLEIKPRQGGVRVVVPHVRHDGEAIVWKQLRALVDQLILREKIDSYC